MWQLNALITFLVAKVIKAQYADTCTANDDPVPQADCLAAVQSVLPQGTVQGRATLVLPGGANWPHVPPGCSYEDSGGGTPGGDYAAHYSDQNGANNGDFVSVCKVPTPVPTSVPTAVPTPIPTSVPTAVPTPMPTVVDCVGKWQQGWTPCSATCGAGTKKRSYTILIYEAAGGAPCDQTAFQTTCYAGDCPTPSVAPTPLPTPSPTQSPTPGCTSLSKKTDKQCASKCDDATSCPTSLTCRMCSESCACTRLAMQTYKDNIDTKTAWRREHRRCEGGSCYGKKFTGQIRGVEYNVPKPPTPPPPVVPCAGSDECEKTFFCWDNVCHDTKDKDVCAKFANKVTTDGWTWTQISQDAHMKCDNKDPIIDYEAAASRPKEEKHLEADHVHWKGFVEYEQAKRKDTNTWPFGGRRLTFV